MKDLSEPHLADDCTTYKFDLRGRRLQVMHKRYVWNMKFLLLKLTCKILYFFRKFENKRNHSKSQIIEQYKITDMRIKGLIVSYVMYKSKNVLCYSMYRHQRIWKIMILFTQEERQSTKLSEGQGDASCVSNSNIYRSVLWLL